MSKKFGITIGFISAFAFFCGWYNFTWLLVGTVLVLLLTDEEVLKKNVLNAFFLAFIFMVANIVLSWVSARYIGFLNKLLNIDAEWLSWFSNIFTLKVYNVFAKLDIAGYLVNIIRILKFVLMVVFFIISLKGKEVKVPLANGLALKVMGLAPIKEKKVKETKEEKDASSNDAVTLEKDSENGK